VGSIALVARRIGAKEPEAANAVAQQSLLLALLIGILAAIILWLGAPLFLAWLGAEPEVIEMGSAYIRAVASTVYMLSILFIGSAIMRGAGDTTSVLIILGVCIWGVRIANAYWLGPLLGLTGIWIAVGADSVVRAVLMSLRFRSGKWKRIQI
jgi:Na+-driven multidrug efflux pump